jgi:T5SS/PEP-CTERM-associated repeat protein
VPPEAASTTIEWQGPGDPPPGSAPTGSFAQTNAWKPLNGDPPRVPQRTQTLNDTALFDRPEAYTVDFGMQHAGRMLVVDGNVTFTSGSIQLDELSDTTPSVVIDNARLTLSFDPFLIPILPMVSGNFGLIGAQAAARVDVVNHAIWELKRVLTIGGPGEGILTVNSGGVVTNGGAMVGGSGGGHVNIGDSGSWTTGNLAVGAGGHGDLTIQDGGHVESEAGFVGLSGNSGNSVLVQGGNTNQVSRWDISYLAIGGGGGGELDIKDGAIVNSALTIIGQVAGGDGSVTVSGVDTNGQSSTLSAVTLLAGQNGNAELNVLDGASVDAGSILLGEYHGASVSAKVSGINVASNTPSTLHADGALVVGDLGPASLEIDSGGQVESERGQVTSFIPQTVSEVKIVGSASSWVIQDDLTVGVNPSLSSNSGQAIVTLVDGYLEADSIYVDAGGMVRGFGTLAVDPANRFTNANGTISPGLSPGTITISGSFQQLAGGQLLMDIGGTNYADNDHLSITNAAVLDGNITFRFLNGFAPKQGQQFDLLSVGGTLTGSFATVGIENLAPGFQFGLVTNGQALSLVASNDGVFSAALPGQMDVTVTNLGGITYANYFITTSNSCQTIMLDGPFTQTGNAFTQMVSGTSFIRSDCADGILTVTNTLLLGALAPGDYSLSTISAGQTMNTLSFTVPGNGRQTLLLPTILADGSIKFQVAGPQSSMHCTIQASLDLKTWVNLASGALPFTFTDPDAVLYSQRYYRALLGP